MKQLKLSALPRAQKGRGPARRLRKAGKIPSIVYGKSGSKPLEIKERDFRALMRLVGSAAALIQLECPDEQPILTVLQAVQRNPLTDQFEHLDFHEISMAEEMTITLPVRLTGEAHGVKNERGILEFVKHHLEIRCLPKHLPEYIEVDVSNLRVGGAIHVRDIPLIEHVTYRADADAVIAMCAEPKLQEETPATPAPAATPAAASKMAASGK